MAGKEDEREESATAIGSGEDASGGGTDVGDGAMGQEGVEDTREIHHNE